MSHRISGSLTSFEVTGSSREDQATTVGVCARETARTSATITKSVYKIDPEALSLFEKRPLALDPLNRGFLCIVSVNDRDCPRLR